MNQDNFPKTIKIPFIVKDGQLLTPDLEKPIPELRSGTRGSIILPFNGISNVKDALKYLHVGYHIMLTSGTKVLIRIKNTSLVFKTKNDYNYLLNCRQDALQEAKRATSLGEGEFFVPAFLFDDLVLALRSTKSAVLNPCRINIPFLKESAESLNNAYTIISRYFEPHRKTHTGNVFKHTYVLKDEIGWQQLCILRDNIEHSYRNYLFNNIPK